MRSTSSLPGVAFCLVVVLLLCSQALASRVPRVRRNGASTAPFVRREVTLPIPSVEDCKKKLDVPKDKAVFYTNDVQASADAWAKEHERVTIWTAGLSAYQKDMDKEIRNAIAGGRPTWDFAKDGATFFEHCAEAFARLADGEVAVVVSPGKEGKPTMPLHSVFADVQWPILTEALRADNLTTITGYVGHKNGTAPTADAGSITPEPCRSAPHRGD